jgi:DNA-binding FrmR family transcriptional regulator
MTEDPTLLQLKRIRGQLDGIISMLEEGRSCVEIVRQVVAARSSLGRVARDLLSGEAGRCSREQRPEDLDAILKEVFRY